MQTGFWSSISPFPHLWILDHLSKAQNLAHAQKTWFCSFKTQSRSQKPRSFWLATGIATSGQVQLRKSAIHGLPVTLRMPRVKSDKSEWFWSPSILFTQPFKTGMSLGLARGHDISSTWQKGPLGTRLFKTVKIMLMTHEKLKVGFRKWISGQLFQFHYSFFPM